MEAGELPCEVDEAVGRGGRARPDPRLGIAPLLLGRKGPRWAAPRFVEPLGSEQDVSLLEETIRNSS